MKILRWSVPPNCASTCRYSSSSACSSGYRMPLIFGFATCFTTSAPALMASCSVTSEDRRYMSSV